MLKVFFMVYVQSHQWSQIWCFAGSKHMFSCLCWYSAGWFLEAVLTVNINIIIASSFALSTGLETIVLWAQKVRAWVLLARESKAGDHWLIEGISLQWSPVWQDIKAWSQKHLIFRVTRTGMTLKVPWQSFCLTLLENFESLKLFHVAALVIN